MKLYMTIVDDFLSDFESLRQWADTAKYEDIENPVDKVVYPLIAKDIPSEVRHEVEMNLMMLMSRPVTINYLFMRLSPEKVRVPHQVHTDTSMGEYSLMLYMNRQANCWGGTSILQHVDGMDRHPANEAELAVWRRDMNDVNSWKITDFCPMRQNRAFVFQSDLFHRAEPIFGFGRGPRKGRLVLTAFFNLVQS